MSVGFHYWGWALKPKNKEISCTHFICVALPENLELEAYYLIESNNLNKFPKGVRQFKNVEHRFGVWFGRPGLNLKNKGAKEFFEKSNSLLEGNIAIKIKSTEKLTDFIHIKK